MPNKGRLLILEDDVHVGKIVKLVAEGSGLEAQLVSTPELFFRAIDEWNPTHIALDLVMPDMDGVQVLTQLASHRCRARIIITSGMGARVLDAAGRSGNERGLQIVGLLPKPFSAAALRALLAGDPAREALAANKSAFPVAPMAHASFAPTHAELHRALLAGEFFLVYQPKIDCKTGVLAGFEALARWNYPERGLVMPDQFIPLLDASGLIDMLTDIVIDQALAWFSNYPAHLTLSVNFSARTFHDAAFLDRIFLRCRSAGVAPQNLIFELTETNTMDDPVLLLDLTTRLRVKGFHLSIDDFGKGYSSLLQLVRLPFSEIKVDKSFVLPIKRSTEARMVVKSIVDLGRSLGLKSVAEGVEDAETLDYLKSIDCDLAQGYGIALPMTGDGIRSWIGARAP